MRKLNGKRILLGITGGIAAYKAAELTRLLRKEGADVRVVMTEAACEFIRPLTLQALSGHPVHSELLDTEAEAGMGHIELARWADVIIIAPATASFIAKMSMGSGEDLLLAICLATQVPLCIAPAMNQAMWSNKITQSNVSRLRTMGVNVFGPDEGEQACGETGYGRMLSPEDQVIQVADIFSSEVLTGKRVLITAGPTRERIDPVRYLSNRSSGKMGFALALASVEAGASVTLVSGPVSLRTPDRVRRINVESAQEMYQAVLDEISREKPDIFISNAAVADYRPATVRDTKIKKSDDESEQANMKLVRNPDILMNVSRLEKNRPFTVGFAAETDNIYANAMEKKRKKHLDMIVVNDISDDSIGFNSEYNAVSVFDNSHSPTTLSVMPKAVLARKIMDLVAESFQDKNSLDKTERNVDSGVIAFNK